MKQRRELYELRRNPTAIVAAHDVFPGQLIFTEAPFLKIDNNLQQSEMDASLFSQFAWKSTQDLDLIRSSSMCPEFEIDLDFCVKAKISISCDFSDQWEAINFHEAQRSKDLLMENMDGIYLKLSLCHHSCSPNTVISVSRDQNISLRAVRHIPKGSRFTRSWIAHLLRSRTDRMTEYVSLFDTECTCATCKRGTVDYVFRGVDDMMRSRVHEETQHLRTILKTSKKHKALPIIEKMITLLECSYGHGYCNILLLRLLHLRASAFFMKQGQIAIGLKHMSLAAGYSALCLGPTSDDAIKITQLLESRGGGHTAAAVDALPIFHMPVLRSEEMALLLVNLKLVTECAAVAVLQSKDVSTEGQKTFMPTTTLPATVAAGEGEGGREWIRGEGRDRRRMLEAEAQVSPSQALSPRSPSPSHGHATPSPRGRRPFHWDKVPGQEQGPHAANKSPRGRPKRRVQVVSPTLQQQDRASVGFFSQWDNTPRLMGGNMNLDMRQGLIKVQGSGMGANRPRRDGDNGFMADSDSDDDIGDSKLESPDKHKIEHRIGALDDPLSIEVDVKERGSLDEGTAARLAASTTEEDGASRSDSQGQGQGQGDEVHNPPPSSPFAAAVQTAQPLSLSTKWNQTSQAKAQPLPLPLPLASPDEGNVVDAAIGILFPNSHVGSEGILENDQSNSNNTAANAKDDGLSLPMKVIPSLATMSSNLISPAPSTQFKQRPGSGAKKIRDSGPKQRPGSDLSTARASSNDLGTLTPGEGEGLEVLTTTKGSIHTFKAVNTKNAPGRVGRQQGSKFKKHVSIATSVLYFDDSCDDSDDDVGSGTAVAGGVGASLGAKKGQVPIRAGAGAVGTGCGTGEDIGAASFAPLQPLLVMDPEPKLEPSVSTTYINNNTNIPDVGSPHLSLFGAPHASPSRVPGSVHSKPQYRPKSFLFNARDPNSSAVEVVVIRSPGAMQGGEEARELQRIRETKSKIDLRSDAVPAPTPSHALPDPSVTVKVQLKVSAHAPGPSTTVASLYKQMQPPEAGADAFRLEVSMPSLNVPQPKTPSANVLRI